MARADSDLDGYVVVALAAHRPPARDETDADPSPTPRKVQRRVAWTDDEKKAIIDGVLHVGSGRWFMSGASRGEQRSVALGCCVDLGVRREGRGSWSDLGRWRVVGGASDSIVARQAVGDGRGPSISGHRT